MCVSEPVDHRARLVRRSPSFEDPPRDRLGCRYHSVSPGVAVVSRVKAAKAAVMHVAYAIPPIGFGEMWAADPRHGLLWASLAGGATLLSTGIEIYRHERRRP
jgi:hypothetical protein